MLSSVVTNLAPEGVTVFRGRGKGLFENVTLQYGLGQPTFALRVGTKWFDYDSDGRLDLFIATGAQHRGIHARRVKS